MVGHVNDTLEHEADRVADQVMRMPELQFQHVCPGGGGCPKCRTEQPVRARASLRTKQVHAGDTAPTAAPPIVHEVLRSPGQPLDSATRTFMESRFGHDFSHVRVHVGAAPAASAGALGAQAYTAGHHIVFGANRYAPQSHTGRHLLAHELAHVVQQGPDPTFMSPDAKWRLRADYEAKTGGGATSHGKDKLRIRRQIACPN